MIALTTFLPGNSSRTSIQAISVPSTPLASAAAAAIASDSFRAARACGEVTTSQKPPAPFSVDDHTSAAIGSATTTERKVRTKPSERAVPALSLR